MRLGIIGLLFVFVLLLLSGCGAVSAPKAQIIDEGSLMVLSDTPLKVYINEVHKGSFGDFIQFVREGQLSVRVVNEQGQSWYKDVQLTGSEIVYLKLENGQLTQIHDTTDFMSDEENQAFDTINENTSVQK